MKFNKIIDDAVQYDDFRNKKIKHKGMMYLCDFDMSKII